MITYRTNFMNCNYVCVVYLGLRQPKHTAVPMRSEIVEHMNFPKLAKTNTTS
jgi:hypothetical protein